MLPFLIFYFQSWVKPNHAMLWLTLPFTEQNKKEMYIIKS